MHYHLLCPMFRMPDPLEQPGVALVAAYSPTPAHTHPPTRTVATSQWWQRMFAQCVLLTSAIADSYFSLLCSLYKWYGMIWLSHAALMIRSQESAYKSEIPLLKSSGPEKAWIISTTFIFKGCFKERSTGKFILMSIQVWIPFPLLRKQ